MWTPAEADAQREHDRERLRLLREIEALAPAKLDSTDEFPCHQLQSILEDLVAD